MPDAIREDIDKLVEQAYAGKTTHVTPTVDAVVNEAYGVKTEPETTKSYEAKVEPGKYPTSGPIDAIAKTAGEYVAEPVMGAVGAVLGAPQRLVASLITGKGLKKSVQNAAPVFLGGTPHDSPSGNQIADYYGIPKPAETEGFDRTGDVNWRNLPNKMLWAAREVLPSTATDLLFYTHPGMSTQGKAAQAAARESILSGTAKFADDIAARSHTMPALHESIARGHTGVTFKVPFGPEIGFIPAPKILAPVAKVMEPVLSTLKKGKELFTGPDARDPVVLKTQRESGIANQKVMQFARQKLVPIEELAGKAELSEQTVKHASDISELFDDDGALRYNTAHLDLPEHIPAGESAAYRDKAGNVHRGKTHVDAMERGGVTDFAAAGDEGNGFVTSKGRFVTRDEGEALQAAWKGKKTNGGKLMSEDLPPVPIQKSWPSALKADFEKLEARRPDVAAATKAEFDVGPTHMTPQLEEALAHFSTLPATQRAAAWEVSQKLAQYARDVREFGIANKVEIPALNADVKARPRQLFDAINAIDKRLESVKPVRDAKSSVKGPLKDLLEKVKSKAELDQLDLDNLARELGGEMPKRPPKELGWVRDEQGNLVREAEPPPVVKDLAFEADELRQRRDIKGTEHRQSTPSHLTYEDLIDLQNALYERVPNAMKQYNAVPNYRPGTVSEATRAEMDHGINPNLKMASQKGRNPETARRSGRVKDIGPKYEDMGDVKKTVYQQIKTLEKGTASTSGNAVRDPWWYKYMNAAGVDTDAIRKSGGAAFMEPNGLKAFRTQLEGPLRKAITNAGLDEAIAQTFDVVPEDLVRKTQDLLYRGVESGEMVPDPRDLKYWHERGKLEAEPGSIGRRQNYQGGGPAADQPVFTKAFSETPGRRPVTLDEMEEFWKKSGREDRFIDHINPETREMLKQKPFHEVMERNWQPANRDLVELGDTTGYLHKGVANDLAVFKRLGTDPTGITNWLRKNAPVYSAYVALTKKMATLWNITAPGYITGNALGDLVRGHIGDAWDWKSPGELKRGVVPHFEYVDSGGAKAAQLPAYDFGPTLGVRRGEQAAEIFERNRIMDARGQTATELQFGESGAAQAVKRVRDVVPAAGKKVENVMRGIDNNHRAGAFAKFMREGASEAEAAFKTEQIFFDYNRRGPVTTFLSQTGIMPFATWNSKIIPYMAHWAMTRPGEFAFVQRVMQAFGNGQIPASQLPAYMRSGTNIPLDIKRDKDGHVSVGIITENGNVIPGNELMQLMRDPARTILSKAGPVLRGLWEAHDQAAMDVKDPNRVTGWDVAKKYGEIAGGRPVSTIKNLLDDEKTAGEKAGELFSPVRYSRYDLTKQGNISRGSAKNALQSAAYAQADAYKAVREAQEAFLAANQGLEQVKALDYLQQDGPYRKAQAELEKQKARYQRTVADFKRIQAEHVKAQKFVERFERVK